MVAQTTVEKNIEDGCKSQVLSHQKHDITAQADPFPSEVWGLHGRVLSLPNLLLPLIAFHSHCPQETAGSTTLLSVFATWGILIMCEKLTENATIMGSSRKILEVPGIMWHVSQTCLKA